MKITLWEQNDKRSIILCVLIFFTFHLSSCSGRQIPPDPSINTENNTRQELILRASIIERATEWLSEEHGGSRQEGVPYSQISGSGPKGIYRADCSGYVSYAWNLSPVEGGLSTVGLYNYGVPIPVEELQPGDILVAEHTHAVIFVGWIDKDAGSFIAYEENGEWKERAIRRPDSLATPELFIDWDYCDHPTTCAIIGEDDGDGSGRGPYTAFQHPEIAALSPTNDQILAAKLPLEELVEIPDMVGPDPLVQELLLQVGTIHDLSIFNPDVPDPRPQDVPARLSRSWIADSPFAGCLLIDRKPTITENIYGVIGKSKTWCFCKDDYMFSDNFPIATLSRNNTVMDEIEGYLDRRNDCIYYDHTFIDSSLDDVYSFQVIITNIEIEDNFHIGINSLYLPGWIADERVRVIFFAYDSFTGEYGYISEGMTHANQQGEVWLKSHSLLDSYAVFLIGDNSDPVEVLIRDEHYSIDPLMMYDKSNPDAGEVVFNRPSQLDGDDQVVLIEEGERPPPPIEPQEYCEAGPLSRLQVGMYAYVGLDHPKTNSIRKKPGINQSLLGRADPGTPMEIIRGPHCKNGYTWWYVEIIGSNLAGWTAEGDHTRYWLVPCENANCPP